jgi:chemotaxis protein histidine kinase CheA
MNAPQAYENDPEFVALREAYIAEARTSAARLLDALKLDAPPPDGPARAELRRLAHNLRGTGGLYGFPDITERAGELEVLLLGGGDAPSLDRAARFLHDAVTATPSS